MLSSSLAVAYDDAPAGVAGLDAAGRFVYANRALRDLLELDADAPASALDARLTAEARAALQASESHASIAEPLRLVWRRTDDAAAADVRTLVALAPLADAADDAGAARTLMMVLGVDGLAQSTRRRERQQRQESLARLAGGLAHDFNNLLVGILGNASLLLFDDQLPEPLKPMLNEIERTANRASELNRELLAYAGRGRFMAARLEVDQLLDQTEGALQATVGDRARLTVRRAHTLPPIKADRTRLRDVLISLVTNAVEALDKTGGEIVVTVGAVEIEADQLRDALCADDLTSGTFVALEVADNGQGMDDTTRDRIFEPFFTTRAGSRGLGLASVLGVVRSHRGAVQVRTTVGEGTRVRLLLPAIEDASISASHKLPAQFAEQARAAVAGGGDDARASKEFSISANTGGGGLILVADDEEVVQRVVRTCLEQAGFAVSIARDGVEAVARFEEQADRIRAVILDMTMPRMDGPEALKAIRALDPDARVILSSGYHEDEAVRRLGDLPVAGFLQKPYRLKELIAMVHRVVRDAG
ncbi:MAG: response regulator [Acidobacteriota bacterium]